MNVFDTKEISLGRVSEALPLISSNVVKVVPLNHETLKLSVVSQSVANCLSYLITMVLKPDVLIVLERLDDA